MKKSTRALVGLVALDLMIVVGIFWLVATVKGGASTTVPPEEAITTITSIGGAAIGIITVLLGMAYFLHRRRGN